MKIIIVKDYDSISEKASSILIEKIKKKPNLVVGFATGETQLGFYKKLVESYDAREVSFSKLKTFNLDEYYPIKKDDKKSFSHYMFSNFFNKVDVKKQNVNLLDGNARDTEKECERYEKEIRKNPMDIQFLGIGENGHVAYNEPGSEADSKTRLIELTRDTIKKKKSGKMALTVGISTILSSREIILLASGRSKAKAVKCLVKGNISSECPASFLRNHKKFTLIVDMDAARLLV